MKSTWKSILALLVSVPAGAGDVSIKVAPAGAHTMRLSEGPKKDDPLYQAVERAKADPYPDASTDALLASFHMRDEQEWEQAFAMDMGQAFRADAQTVSVPLEYRPNPYAISDGFGIVQLLANAVLRARLPCRSVTTVDSIISANRGWILVCDRRTNVYSIMLFGRDWRLKILTTLHNDTGANDRKSRRK